MGKLRPEGTGEPRQLSSPGLGDSGRLSGSPEGTQQAPGPAQAAIFPGSLDAHQGAGRGHHWPVPACPGESALCPCGDLRSSQTCFPLRIPGPCPRWVLLGRVTGASPDFSGAPQAWGPHPVMAPTLEFPGLDGTEVLFAGSWSRAASSVRSHQHAQMQAEGEELPRDAGTASSRPNPPVYTLAYPPCTLPLPLHGSPRNTTPLAPTFSLWLRVPQLSSLRARAQGTPVTSFPNLGSCGSPRRQGATAS